MAVPLKTEPMSETPSSEKFEWVKGWVISTQGSVLHESLGPGKERIATSPKFQQENKLAMSERRRQKRDASEIETPEERPQKKLSAHSANTQRTPETSAAANSSRATSSAHDLRASTKHQIVPEESRSETRRREWRERAAIRALAYVEARKVSANEQDFARRIDALNDPSGSKARRRKRWEKIAIKAVALVKARETEAARKKTSTSRYLCLQKPRIYGFHQKVTEYTIIRGIGELQNNLSSKLNVANFNLGIEAMQTLNKKSFLVTFKTKEHASKALGDGIEICIGGHEVPLELSDINSSSCHIPAIWRRSLLEEDG